MSPVDMPAQTPTAAGAAVPVDEVDASCRLPLLVLFLSAAVWLVIASLCALVASLKFHAPGLLADVPWLTYGRVLPAGTNAMLYGFCLQAGLGVALWLLARLGRVALAQPWLVVAGAVFWNLGVTLGAGGILAGDSTGFETLEMPGYAGALLFLGYLMMGLWGAVTFHQRRERPLFVSQWFLFAALFWFPWIYSTAELLLVSFPVRGVAQPIIAWWYANNLAGVWLGLVGLAAVFYFVPKLTSGELHSHFLALFTFWMLILFGSWGGIPVTAPVPAWMPVLSTVATVLTSLVFITVALNLYYTTGSLWPRGVSWGPAPGVRPSSGAATAASPTAPAGSNALVDSKLAAPEEGRTPGAGPGGVQPRARAGYSLPFVWFGAAAFIAAGLMSIFGPLLDANQELHFTWFTPAQNRLNTYGFFAMAMFGAVYYILPRLTGTGLPRPRLAGLHFWLAATGVGLFAAPLAIGGIVQALKLQNARIPFLEVANATLPFLRISTIGDLLLLLGNLVFAINLFALAVRFYRVRFSAAYATATADLYPTAEVKS